MIIEVYDSPSSSKVIATFKSRKAFDKWMEENCPDLNADRVAINDMVLLGWDEY